MFQNKSAVIFGFVLSTALLIVIEIGCVVYVWFPPRQHVPLPLRVYALPIMIFLPWGYCTKGLSLLRRSVRLRGYDSDVSYASVYFAFAPFWAYVLLLFVTNLCH